MFPSRCLISAKVPDYSYYLLKLLFITIISEQVKMLYCGFHNTQYTIVDINLAEGFQLYIVAIRSGNFLGLGLLAEKLNPGDIKM